MLIKTYCKNNELKAFDVIESLTSKYPGVWTPTSKLSELHLAFLDITFKKGSIKETKQLAASTEVNQVSSSEIEKVENQEIEKVESQGIEKTENVIQALSAHTTQILQANLEIQKRTVQQLLDNSNSEILDLVSQNGEKLNNQLMENLEADFHQPQFSF